MKIIFITILLLITTTITFASDDEWGRKYDEIVDTVCENIAEECLVRYSAYPMDENSHPINNLNEIAITGNIIIIHKHEPFWGTGSDFMSKMIKNPTWLDLSRIANKMIHTTGDMHHIYLEDISVIKTIGPTKYITFYMGS